MPQGSEEDAGQCDVHYRAVEIASLSLRAEAALARCPVTADLLAVQRTVADARTRGCKAYNGKRPIIKVIAHEYDPRRARRSAAKADVSMATSVT